MDASMAVVGLKEVETYILSFQNTVTQYIMNFPLQELYLVA